MSFTISFSGYEEIKSGMGTSGVGVLSEFGEQLRAKIGRKSVITFMSGTRTVTIHQSAQISRTILEEICARFQNHPWAPKLLETPEGANRKIRMICSHGRQLSFANTLTKRPIADEELLSDGETDTHDDKKVRRLASAVSDLELTESLSERFGNL